MNFIVPDEKLAIQVSYSINEEATFNREVSPLVKYSKAHEDYNCLLITYDDEGTEEGIPVVPVWKLLMDGGLWGDVELLQLGRSNMTQEERWLVRYDEVVEEGKVRGSSASEAA